MTEVDIAPDIGVSLQLVVATAAILGNIALHTIATVAVIAGLRRFEPTMSKLLGDAFIAVPMMVAAATLGMLVAHTIEIWGWAVMLLWLGEFSNLESALYFSVVTFSTLGYGDIVLDHQWRLLGAMASVNGIILFGWTTAVVVAVLTSAIERLEPAISRADAHLARQLDTKFVAVPEPSKRWSERSSEIIDEVMSALVYNNPVDARYQKVTGSVSEKLLHPFTLATYRQGLYLFAFDVAVGQVRTYALERFTDLRRRRNERFEVPTGWQPRAHIAHAFGIISSPPEHVAIAFSPAVTGYIRERVWHPTQTFRERSDGWLELGLTVGVTVELVNWVCSFGSDAEALKPVDLRSRVAESLSKAASYYDDEA